MRETISERPLRQTDAALGTSPGEKAVAIIGPQACGLIRNPLAARRAGFRIAHVADARDRPLPEEAARADVIVLDFSLERALDSWACQRIVSLSASHALLVVTGTDDELERILSLQLGADDCVSRTCSEHELLARLKAVLRRRRPPAPPPPSDLVLFGDFEMSKRSRVLRHREDGYVPLSPTDYDLLELLVLNAGRTVTLGMIDERFRAHLPENPGHGPVRVYRLRRRLKGFGGGDRLIRTVHRAGYVLDAAVNDRPASD